MLGVVSANPVIGHITGALVRTTGGATGVWRARLVVLCHALLIFSACICMFGSARWFRAEWAFSRRYGEPCVFSAGISAGRDGSGLSASAVLKALG